MVMIMRKLEFDAGHRVVKHESKCAHLHGHRYVLEVTVDGQLDPLGRVLDFSVLKTKLGGWIDDFLDHGLILFKDDPQLEKLKSLHCGFLAQKVYVMPTNPTAENMALHLFKTVFPKLLSQTGVDLVKLRVWETPNCYAEVSRDDLPCQ